MEYQDKILPGVSRTFALTIPQLPEGLRRAVTNAYLLCRIADTIEDDAELADADKSRYHQEFLSVLRHDSPARDFAEGLSGRLSKQTIPDEVELVRNTQAVVETTFDLNDRQQAALRRCVNLMCRCMPRYQRADMRYGLESQAEMDAYCYCVAGVVGEMLTDLFCDYSPEIERHREQLWALAASFGQGLQMTNILKDVWEDHDRGACWLPRDVFLEAGYDLKQLSRDLNRDSYTAGIECLIGVAHAHLKNALEYTLLIPRTEIGIRRFCLWAIGLAVLTLKRIHANPGYRSGQDVKVSRRVVRATVAAANATLFSNTLLRGGFSLAASGLPVATLNAGQLSAARQPR